MKFFSKRWRMALIAVFAAFAVSLSLAGTASAAQPGEGNKWTPETFNGATPISTPLTIGEARQGDGSIIDVWRGETDNHVWVSLDHGSAFQIGTTATNFAPTVVPWGTNRFMIFHTGTDNNIYYTWVDTAGNNAGTWVNVPGQSTTAAVSVTQLGQGDFGLYMVYRSSNSDDHIWGTLFNPPNGNFPAQNAWTGTAEIEGGLSPSAPSVTYSQFSNTVYAVARGNDNQIWLNSANGANLQWRTWQAFGGAPADQPTIAAAQNDDGNVLISYRDANLHINYGLFNEGGTFSGWQPDITNWQSLSPVFLSVIAGIFYAIITGRDNVAYWKPVVQ